MDLSPIRGQRRRRTHQQERYSGRSNRVGAAGARRDVHPAAPALRRLGAAPQLRAARRPGGAVVHPALENAVPRERIYFGNYEAQPMSVMRQRIAEHMVALEARFASRLFDRRSGHDPNRHTARALESRVRNQVRHAS